MARTKEERDANDAIEAAIEDYRIAYRESHPDAVLGTLTDWVVIAAETQPDLEDGDNDIDAYSIIMPRGGIPVYRAEGLLRRGIHYLNTSTEE